MTLIVHPQDWLFGLAGGLMIGLAAALLLLGNGRIMGASGIVSNALNGAGPRTLREDLPFLLGLIGAPALAVLALGAPDSHVSGDLPMLALAGILVGAGTKLANGCTSGHGVCGMSRFSLRSIVATACYLGAGAVSFFVARHLLGVI
ncbi:MAG: YeeE/YedE family protein [Rhodobacter sp.]|uniref:YeeE/YedE family protein n=1 Tax=Pararhodobacter sp. TaxID=2127056 RepID=UPI001DC24EF8|nr:YeeE/YedE family protein [Pararhodobacter sp.]MCB1345257.1 YeeE/YedE family protein [Paracoccaceae bacterium]MCC0073184.1 YeeE/YedE family protein [Rhodobacter sp.]HPD91662.1 YeeE/YedE family protein [Pararhodobacter sp.]